MRFVIGIDIGTTNTKAVAFTEAGEVIAQASRTYAPIVPTPGAHELDPEILLDATLQSLREVVAQTGSAALAGISFSSAMHSLIAVNAEGRPITQVITWADLRSKEQAVQLKHSGQGQRLYQRIGVPIHPMLPLCKLMWMRSAMPAVYQAADKFIGIKEYILHQLTGQYLIDHSIACGTGLFDIYALDWHAEALQLAGITPAQLSKPVSTDHIVTGIHNRYAAQLSIPDNTPLIMGASDGCLANVGSFAVMPGDMAVTVGTSGAVRMITDSPKHDPQGRTFNYILTKELFVCGGPINNGGVLLKWFADTFMQRNDAEPVDFAQFLRSATAAPAGADGLLFLPYIQGERAPVWDPYAKGLFLGIDARHTQAHFQRAVIEGINYALFQVAQAVEQTVGKSSHIYVSGGFIQSGEWVQWLTNLFGKSLTVTNAADASATGAAIVGLVATGCLENLSAAQRFMRVQEQFVPVPALHQLYLQRFSIYDTLYERFKDTFSGV